MLAAIPAIAVNGFCKCRIFPLDPKMFSVIDFEDAEVSDTLMDPQNNDLNVAKNEANYENALVEHGDGPISTEEEVVAVSNSRALVEKLDPIGGDWLKRWQWLDPVVNGKVNMQQVQKK